MNWSDIYNRVVFKVWGNTGVPQGTQDVLQGEYGIIANVHRKIQEEYDYWFMEKTGSLNISTGTNNYDLPSGFKEIGQSGIRVQDNTTYDYYTPLTPLLPGESDLTFRDYDGTAEYPLYYEIYGGQLYVFPTPSQPCMIFFRYFGYLDRPPAVFGNTSDALTVNGYDAIIGLAAAEMCRILEEFQKAQVFEDDAIGKINILKQQDSRMRRAEVKTCQYVGF